MKDEGMTTKFQGYDGSNFRNMAQISVLANDAVGSSDSDGNIVFSTTTSGGTALAEKMRITESAKVGIGTNNPGSNLVVSSSTKTDVLVGGNSSVFSDNGRSNVEINGSGTSTLSMTIGGASKGLLFHDGTNSYFRNYANGYFAIYTNNAEKVRVDNSGTSWYHSK